MSSKKEIDTLQKNIESLISNWNTYQNDINEPSTAGAPFSKEDFNSLFVSAVNFLSSPQAEDLFNAVLFSNISRTNIMSSNLANINAWILQLKNNNALWVNIADATTAFFREFHLLFSGGTLGLKTTPGASSLSQQVIALSELLKKVEQNNTTITQAAENAKLRDQDISEILKKAKDLKIKIDIEIENLEKYKRGLISKGLAGSYSSRVNWLTVAQIFWSLMIFASLGLICFLENRVQFKSDNMIDILFSTLGKITSALPALILTWFSIKQYNKTVAIKEDYEFKVKTAESFYAYKNEAAVDPQLQSKLLESVIKSFEEKPSFSPASHLDTNHPTEDLWAIFQKAKTSDTIDFLQKIRNLLK